MVLIYGPGCIYKKIDNLRKAAGDKVHKLTQIQKRGGLITNIMFNIICCL